MRLTYMLNLKELIFRKTKGFSFAQGRISKWNKTLKRLIQTFSRSCFKIDRGKNLRKNVKYNSWLQLQIGYLLS